MRNSICWLLWAFFSMLPVVVLPADEAGETLQRDELSRLLMGKTVRGIQLDNNKPFVRFHDAHGNVRQRAGEGSEEQGHWFINQNGQRCIVWSNKEQNCRLIVKDNALYKEFLIQKNGKRKFMVIYSKIVEGNPDGL